MVSSSPILFYKSCYLYYLIPLLIVPSKLLFELKLTQGDDIELSRKKHELLEFLCMRNHHMHKVDDDFHDGTAPYT
ncbi:hypothetical protein H5410_063681 [Solanum commersonii]|uniref:Uncharacterized protein n=1 Tax=Solanum commersonii TaxID=4109 RepID=A0A9J5WDW1_SOLCO|nr:hypothetical protein H5410_063681 [Solanum commersonii]